MNRGSTHFLRAIICLMGLFVLGLLIIFAGVSFSGNAGVFLPMLLGMFVPAIPFYIALYFALQLLKFIDTNTAFSEKSVRALKGIKYCAFAISTLYAAGMPLVIYVANKGDEPRVVLLELLLIGMPLVFCVFAAVLERLFQNALDFKSENDLTV